MPYTRHPRTTLCYVDIRFEFSSFHILFLRAAHPGSLASKSRTPTDQHPALPVLLLASAFSQHHLTGHPCAVFCCASCFPDYGLQLMCGRVLLCLYVYVVVLGVRWLRFPFIKHFQSIHVLLLYASLPPTLSQPAFFSRFSLLLNSQCSLTNYRLGVRYSLLNVYPWKIISMNVLKWNSLKPFYLYTTNLHWCFSFVVVFVWIELCKVKKTSLR